MTAPEVDALVVGAGPTGLALALQAHLHGAEVRIVERRSEAFRPSRAMIMHPRTLEVLRPLDVTDGLLDAGDAAPSARLHLGSRAVPVRLGDFDLPDTSFPHLLLIRQADVETVLASALADHGVQVERMSRLVALRQSANGCAAVVETGDEHEEILCRYAVGCDGAGSTVRAMAEIAWHSAPYAQEIVLADLELDGELGADAAHAVVGSRGLVFLFAGGEHGSWRMLATRPAGVDMLPFGQVAPGVPDREVYALLECAGLTAHVTDVAWSARVRLQHAIASRYRCGRIFLAGDAAHSHSPAGAQGMNLGIQDAANLGWKLAIAGGVRHQSDHAVLLCSYEAERRPVAQRTLALTRALFWAEAGTDPLMSLARGVLAPLSAPVVPVLMRQRRLLAEGVRTLSGLRVHYRNSPLSRATAGGSASDLARVGDRIPDADICCDGSHIRLHELLAAPGIHLLLHRDAAEPQLPAGGRIRIHRITSWSGAGVLAVRPDGYVGFAAAALDYRLREWLALVGSADTYPAEPC